jgi:hypothetical protein
MAVGTPTDPAPTMMTSLFKFMSPSTVSPSKQESPSTKANLKVSGVSVQVSGFPFWILDLGYRI